MGQSQEMEVGQAHMDTTTLFSASDQKGRQCVHKIPLALGVENQPLPQCTGLPALGKLWLR